MSRYFSPLRYPGGKGRLSTFIQQAFEQNGLVDGCYVEPYAGGAAVGVSLLQLEYASCIYLNDINKPIYYFWEAVLNDTDELCKMISDKSVTVDEWKRQRNVLRNFRHHSRVSVGFATFFINRTNRSGIIHTGGLIGGYNQTGQWKLDARYNKQQLISRIQGIALYSNRIRVFNKDAEIFIDQIEPTLPRKTLMFLDPPYYEQGHRLYENHYSPVDHARVARMVKTGLRTKWIVSYDNHPEIRKAYAGCRRMVYSLPYSAGDKYEGSEVMFFSHDLRIPKTKSPLLC